MVVGRILLGQKSQYCFRALSPWTVSRSASLHQTLQRSWSLRLELDQQKINRLTRRLKILRTCGLQFSFKIRDSYSYLSGRWSHRSFGHWWCNSRLIWPDRRTIAQSSYCRNWQNRPFQVVCWTHLSQYCDYTVIFKYIEIETHMSEKISTPHLISCLSEK